MENRIENAIDGMLDSIFGGLQPQVLLANVIVGIILAVLGLKFIRKSSDEKGWLDYFWDRMFWFVEWCCTIN